MDERQILKILSEREAAGQPLAPHEQQHLAGLRQKFGGRAAAPPRTGGHPGAQQGGSPAVDPAKQQQLLMALMGRVDPLSTNTVAAGLNVDPAAVRSPQETLSAILARGRMEGAPPAPYETKFANMGDLTTALLNQTVDPRIRGQAEQSLLSSIQQSGKVPSSVLEAAFRSR